MNQTLTSLMFGSDLFGAAAYPEQELLRDEARVSNDHVSGQSTFALLNETLSLEQLRCDENMISEWFPDLPAASADQ